MVMHLYVKSTSQESEWSCICMLEVQARRVSGHIFALGVQNLPVPSQESEWSCICMQEYNPGE